MEGNGRKNDLRGGDVPNKPDIERRGERTEEFPRYNDRLRDWLDKLRKGEDDLVKPPDFYSMRDNESSDKPEIKTLPELHKEYNDELKENSEYPETIEPGDGEYEKVSPEENVKGREEFNEKREDLIKEWEEKNEKAWPRYEEDVYDEKTGKLIRKAGDRYDAHHIKPLSLGGKNEAGNITPISADKHHDKRGIHAPGSAYDKLARQVKEAA